MKNSILTLVILLCSLTVIIGCGGKNELKEIRALVTSVDLSNDSIKSMTASLDGDSLIFTMKDVRLNNGMMIKGDSVIINYIDGRNDSLRALVVTILPQVYQLKKEIAANDTLVTSIDEPAKADSSSIE